MSDYIDKQAAIKAIGERPIDWTGSDFEIAECWMYDACKSAIENLPAADVRPVVRGLPVLKYRPQRYERYEEIGLNEKGEMLYLKRVYVDEKNYAMYCPVCGKRLCSRFTNFCPNCGTDMRG